METVTRGGRARHASTRLFRLVRRDWERICAVTLPGPNARLGYRFPAHEVWVPHLLLLEDRARTIEGRERLRALRLELARYPRLDPVPGPAS